MSWNNGKGLGREACSKEDHETRLADEWKSKLPCASCSIASICKYANIVGRINYPSDVFNISIECKISNKYHAIKEERL